MRIILNFEQEVKPLPPGRSAWRRRTVVTRWKPLSPLTNANTRFSAAPAARDHCHSWMQLPERDKAHPTFCRYDARRVHQRKPEKSPVTLGSFCLMVTICFSKNNDTTKKMILSSRCSQ